MPIQLKQKKKNEISFSKPFLPCHVIAFVGFATGFNELVS